MAAGAGLWVLALVVTALHFVIAYGLTGLARRLRGGQESQLQVEVVYADGRGLLRTLLQAVTSSGWSVVRARPVAASEGSASVTLDLSGAGIQQELVATLSGIDGVSTVQVLDDEDE